MIPEGFVKCNVCCTLNNFTRDGRHEHITLELFVSVHSDRPLIKQVNTMSSAVSLCYPVSS